ncbi:MAG: tetratricopeptide repeat protein [Phycisphaerae bacterium]|jgi:tetratricopeptide (TPR) repeat protein
MPDKRHIKVFLASPGDLAVERRAFKDQIDLLNLGFADGAGVAFEALGWEDTLAATGRRPQTVINAEIERCDVFILAMRRRWGQEAPDSQYSSYTEEEFHLALERWNRTKSPEIFVFFKHVDAESMGDPGPQLAKILRFRRELEQSRNVLYRFFEDEDDFRQEIDRHLRAYAKGKLPKADADRDKIILPIEYRKRVEQAEAEARKEAKRAEKARQHAEAQAARAEELALTTARQAAQAALDGHAEEARQAFARALQGTSNLTILSLALEFYNRTGDLAQAEEISERCLAVSGRDSQTADTAAAWCNLGVIYHKRGDLQRAEEMHRKSLEIAEALDDREVVATNCVNLGVIGWRRGELDHAEELHLKAMGIYQELERGEGMANVCGNLGLIYMARRDFDHAEQMLEQALRHQENLGRLEDMARDYGNLGLIYRERGQFDRAEEAFRKSLRIDEKLGRLEGMAFRYRNLGDIYADRGDRPAARKHWVISRDLFALVGAPHEVAKVQARLDELADNAPPDA